MSTPKPHRRSILRLGTALLGGGSLAACSSTRPPDTGDVRGRSASPAESDRVWIENAGNPYAPGSLHTPGV
ncbi:MAG: hypothetical protein ACI80N_004123, partial [Gammaproteobacteria bacterium]